MSQQCYGPQCEAVSGNRKRRCPHKASAQVDGHKVCMSHARYGFIPLQPDTVGDTMRERMARVTAED